ncbi:MAG: SIS domain-containing protein [Candidatus Gastranaerophilales bacterium]|nr:SIS domain-containing protein [Candidatus Gastranaerophilales bacterium]
MRNDDNTGIIASINTNILGYVQSFVVSMNKNESAKKTNMELEIQEQPDIVTHLIENYITPENYILINLPLKIKKVILIASGSSYHCAYATAELLKDLAHCDAECVYSCEFNYNPNLDVNRDTLFIFISQSGETSDTLAALKEVAKKTDNILCITNHEDSTIWQLSNYKINTLAGIEMSIASTKALCAQLMCCYLLVLKIMYSKNIDITLELKQINNLPALLNDVISKKEQIKEIAKKISKFQNLIILGSREFYALAKENALKVTETSYINSVAYPQGEFMHGHLAVLNQKAALISFIDEENQDLYLNNLRKIKEEYNPYIVSVTGKNIRPDIDEIADFAFKNNAESKIFNIFGTLLFAQLVALEIAKALHRNIDRPIGLKKVVIN